MDALKVVLTDPPMSSKDKSVKVYKMSAIIFFSNATIYNCHNDMANRQGKEMV